MRGIRHRIGMAMLAAWPERTASAASAPAVFVMKDGRIYRTPQGTP